MRSRSVRPAGRRVASSAKQYHLFYKQQTQRSVQTLWRFQESLTARPNLEQLPVHLQLYSRPAEPPLPMSIADETSPRMTCGEQHGLKWERDTFSLTPAWTVDPSIECIKDICYGLLKRLYAHSVCYTDIEVKFLDEGAFNRVYEIDATVEVNALPEAQLKTGIVSTNESFKYAFRVGLPVDPQLKSWSEVATIEYLKTFTTIPVTTVLHSSQTAKNALGFEWMLQTYVPGHKLSSIWEELGDNGREWVIKQLATIQEELFRKARFRQIGNIYREREDLASDERLQDNLDEGNREQFYVGKIVSNPFIMSSAVMKIVNRGPFRTTADWFSTHLGNVLLNCERLQKSSDDDDLEAAERSGGIARQLLAILPQLFSDDRSSETTFLHHHDLNRNNIFCAADGTITAILDWEATSCLPLWTAYDFPQLLQGLDYPEKPDPTEYLRGADDELFQDHLLMWQQMNLRATYRETMGRIWPEWEKEHENVQNCAQRDFQSAAELCEYELWWKSITNWLKANDQLFGTERYIRLAVFS